MQLQIFLCKPFQRHLFLFLSSSFLDVELLGHRVNLCQPFKEPPNLFRSCHVHHFTPPSAAWEGSRFCASSPALLVFWRLGYSGSLYVYNSVSVVLTHLSPVSLEHACSHAPDSWLCCLTGRVSICALQAPAPGRSWEHPGVPLPCGACGIGRGLSLSLPCCLCFIPNAVPESTPQNVHPSPNPGICSRAAVWARVTDSEAVEEGGLSPEWMDVWAETWVGWGRGATGHMGKTFLTGQPSEGTLGKTRLASPRAHVEKVRGQVVHGVQPGPPWAVWRLFQQWAPWPCRALCAGRVSGAESRSRGPVRRPLR